MIQKLYPANTNTTRVNFTKLLGGYRHSETQEELVVYRALYDSPEFGPNALWTRPKKMFQETIVFEGNSVPRFQYLGER